MSAPDDAKERHAALAREIDAHNYRYYVLDDPSVSDLAFDLLLRELRALEAAHPDLVTADSPTQRVGERPRDSVTKVTHAVRMYSLDNAYTLDELGEFHDRVKDALPDSEAPRFTVEPKLDGASVEVVYEAGRLALASTRGDGFIGEEITQNVRTIRGLPTRITHEKKLTLRGEIVILKEDFALMNAEREEAGEAPFANPRNAAAGAVRMMDSREVAKRPLKVVFYQAVEGPSLHGGHAETLEWLASIGLPTHRRHTLCAWDDVPAAISAIDGARHGYPFETDGAVVKVDRYRQQEILGFTSKSPRWAVAYKFPPEQAETTVRAIEVWVGRTGVLTPVATFDEVHISGTRVVSASLHNADQVKELDVRVGDRIVVQKAGEIIPQVVRVLPEKRAGGEAPFVMPARCPQCGTEVVKDAAYVATRCPNAGCPAQVMGRILHFGSKTAMAIDHLGFALVDQLVRRGLVRDVSDLYVLREEDVLALERMGKKSAKNVIDAIAKSKEKTLARLLCGLGIPEIGHAVAKQLAESVVTAERLLALAEPELREQVDAIQGFGEKMVASVVRWLGDAENRALLERLVVRGVGRPQPIPLVAASGPLVGKSFCVTGVLSRKREDVHEDIRARGGEVHDSVKKNTTYLVAGEKTGKSKLEQAKKFGTLVIDEAKLDVILRDGPGVVADVADTRPPGA